MTDRTVARGHDLGDEPGEGWTLPSVPAPGRSTEQVLTAPAEAAAAPRGLDRAGQAQRRPRRLLEDRRWGLPLLDTGVAAAAVALSVAVAAPQVAVGRPWFVLAALLPLLWCGCLLSTRAYERRYLWSGSPEGSRVLAAGGILLALVTAAGWLWLPTALAVPSLLVVASVVFSTLVSRWLVRTRSQGLHRSGAVRLRVLAVGPAADVDVVTRRMERNRYHGWKVVAACTPDGAPTPTSCVRLGGPGDVVASARRAHADVVLLCPGLSVADIEDLRAVQQELEQHGSELAIAPPLIEAIGPRVSITAVCGLPVVRLGLPELTGPRRLLKAVADRVVSLLALLALSPLLLVLAVAVKASSRGPVLFRQVRVGRGGRQFSMLKFRSMYVDAEARRAELMAVDEGAGLLFKLREDPRVTRVGALLRRTSLDELPQLVNILLGQMSFVGPRPSLPSEVAHYDDFIRRRLLVTPGLTGLWQVHGRSDLSWVESRRLDVRYVENWSLGFDLSIIVRTVDVVLRGRGAY